LGFADAGTRSRRGFGGTYVTRIWVLIVYHCRYALQVSSSCKHSSTTTCSGAVAFAHAFKYCCSFAKKGVEVFDPFLVHL
jgi:hypothetical protein